jgi:4-hydroxy-3-polyprenylbenzoate decarboxylase
VDDLDHASQVASFGSKMGIDATKKWPQEGFVRPWPDMIEMSPEVKSRVDELWASLGIRALPR